jgi:multisubunit Na+/H+ antiporter MnhB subunit
MSERSFPSRLGASWRNLEAAQRRSGLAAMALFVTMFLPWYSKSAVGVVKGKPVKVDDSLSAFGAFSFVEAAVLLVATGVLLLLFARGEDRPFHLPGGDGTIITAAGVWVCLLVFYRQLDKPGSGKTEGLETTVGVTWGIFVTFLAGLFLAYAGNALRTAHVTEPPLPGDVGASTGPPPDVPERHDPAAVDRRPRPSADRAPTVVAPRTSAGRRQAEAEAEAEQLSFEDAPDEQAPPTRRQLPFGEPPEFEDSPS